MMVTNIAILYLLVLLLQTWHILEEIGLEAYREAGSLKTYLLVAAGLVLFSYLPLALILLDLRAGYWIAVGPALLALGNGVIHVVGWIQTGSVRGTRGAGVFSGIPLGVAGGWLLVRLLGIVLG
jgi:hypothetical protein